MASQNLIAQVSPEAQQLVDDMGAIANGIDNSADIIVPVAGAVLFFVAGAYVIKRLLFSA